MKVASIIELVLTNIVLLVLYSLVTQDYATRFEYWRSIGFIPTFDYAPLVLVLSSANGGTRIPGLLTLDWAQLFLISLIIIDGVFAAETALRHASKTPDQKAL